ncbi:MAG: biotin/lipoyl-binding protein, partial [Candidatus Nanopelagicales bacterium]
GDPIEAASIIGTVETLRGGTPVNAPHGGVVVEWLVEDGDPVSPGQPLIRLHPIADHSVYA